MKPCLTSSRETLDAPASQLPQRLTEPNPAEGPTSAMQLTDAEWADLAVMVKHYRACTEWADRDHGGVPSAHTNGIRLRRDLALRIIGAVS